MTIKYLQYYLLHLIKDGHKWQYTNINNNGEKPRLYFTSLQFFAIVISLMVVLSESRGLPSNIRDNILVCLSIMVALFMNLIMVVIDKSKDYGTEQENENFTDIKKIQLFNFFSQILALISYAILLSIMVIFLVFVNIVIDDNLNLIDCIKTFDNFSLSIPTIMQILYILFIVIQRFLIVYFFIDFFIICIYVVCSTYSFIKLEFQSKEPDKRIIREQDIKKKLSEDFGFGYKIFKFIICACFIALFLTILYQIVSKF